MTSISILLIFFIVISICSAIVNIKKELKKINKMFLWSPKNLKKLRISQQSLRKFSPKIFSFRYAAGLQSSVTIIINKTHSEILFDDFAEEYLFFQHLVVARLKSTYFSDTPRSISLKISTIFLDPRLYESSENCLKLQETVLDVQELFESTENCLKIRKTAWDFRELFESFENCLRRPRTV